MTTPSANPVAHTAAPGLATGQQPRPARGFLSGFARYALRRLIVLALTAVAAVYIVLLAANMGGFVDEIFRRRIEWGAALTFGSAGPYRDLPLEERERLMEEHIQELEAAVGLDVPFLSRITKWAVDGMTLQWEVPPYGRYGNNVTPAVRELVLTHLTRSLYIFGTANVILFFVTIVVALALSRRHGGLLDRLFILLSPLSSLPAWVYGVIMLVVLLKVFGISTGGTFDAWPETFRLEYVRPMVRHLSLPFLAVFLSGLFQGVFVWRTFFVVYGSDDSVELARAKGLPPGQIQRRYILRPALPAVLTSFTLMLITLWQELIVLEVFFKVQGLGWLFIRALENFDMPVIVSIVVIFVYLLLGSVFVLDIAYALLDPRVRIQGEKAGRAVRKNRSWWGSLRSVLPGVGGPVIESTGVAPAGGAQKSSAARAERREEVEALEPPVAPVGGDGGRTGLPEIGTGSRAKRSEGADAPQVPAAPLADSATTPDATTPRIVALFRTLADYPAAIAGVLLIMGLLAFAAYGVLTIPYEQAIALWRGEESVWVDHARNAYPAWVNHFRREKLPETIRLSSRDAAAGAGSAGVVKEVVPLGEGLNDVIITYPIDFDADVIPQDVALFFDASYAEKPPFVNLVWLTPDGRELDLGTVPVRSTTTYYFNEDEALERWLANVRPSRALFLSQDDLLSPNPEAARAQPGEYALRVEGVTFEEGATLDAKLVVYGLVEGWAGTDIRRRDIGLALLWGAPVALSFGIIAAGNTTIGGMRIAAAGAWVGGWLDRTVQALTEVNLVLPFLPVSIMVYTVYSKSF
ncbi:MAG: ABC transporter permease subunit, partial [Candidatus Promineifilaceae bacterium]|nr:ABC transporter permease subunit [Candidatus Promineifilaceae bacterium]